MGAQGGADAVSALRRLNPSALVWAISAAAAVLAGVLSFVLSPAPDFLDWSWTWLALLPAFALGEILVIHLPTVRNSHSHTLREVPAIAGLSFLASGEYLTAYVLGSGLALLLWSRQRGQKLVFNLAVFGLEATLGQVVFHAVLGAEQPTHPRGWLAAAVTVLVTNLVTVLAVTAAISLTEGAFDGTVLREALTSGNVAATVNTCLALQLVVLVHTQPQALPLLGVTLLMLVVAYRAFVALGSGYARLQLLYRFVGVTGRATEMSPAVDALLAEAAELLRANRAELVLLPGVRGDLDAGVRVRLADSVITREPAPVTGAEDAWWAASLEGQAVRHCPSGRRRRSPQDIDPGPARGGLAVPLLSDDVQFGVLLVLERSFEEEAFTEQDLRLLQTLAGHAAVALAKANLVDRLGRIATQREHEALHDSLTGLANRRGLLELLTRELTQHATGAVMIMDLNDFKDVNDTLGHSAGDDLLRVVGQRLSAGLRGTTARLGGDEFAVLLLGVDAAAALTAAHRAVATIAEPVPLEGLTLTTTMSVGIALIGIHGHDADDLLARADAAMYVAKNTGTRVELYRPEDSGATHRRLLLAGELPEALEHHRYEVWYQPQADASTGRITGAEALLRWKHPVFGFVPPPELVAIAERTGLIRSLTDAVITDALHQRAAWAASGHQLDISVNITPADLRDPRLPDTVARLLLITATPPEALTLEITESGVMTDPERCLAVLDALAALRVRLSVDDFGTGYSSLAYLERLPVNEVKIDRTFVQRLEASAHDATVIRATIALAHDLGLQVVAEGIETQTGWDRIAALGCELIQGFYLCRPLPAERTLGWLEARTSRGTTALEAGRHRAQ